MTRAECIRTNTPIRQSPEKLYMLCMYARQHKFKAEVLTGELVVRVWDNDGEIVTSSYRKLKQWLGY